MTRGVRGHHPDRERSRGQAMVEFALAVPILFVLFFGVIEMGRFVFYYETLNHAAREGARYAIVHGARADCPSGPPPPGTVNQCDPNGDNIKVAVVEAAQNLATSGELFVHEPVWTSRGSLRNPQPGDASTGNSARGEYVTVFVTYEYLPIIAEILDTSILPIINITAESTLVINT